MRQTWGKKVAIVLAFAVAILPLLNVSTADAAQITNRKLQLIGVGTNGGSAPGVAANHQFTFTIPTTGTVGSVKFEYCTVAVIDACTGPTGLDASGATFGNETGSAVTGFSMDAKTTNSFILTRSAASVTGGAVAVLQANNVINPTTANQTFFVRITTYTAAAGGGSAVDTGTVAASTASPIQLTGTMPESLIFCTGGTVATNCTSTTSGSITFNQLFSPTDTATATSQMAASTNAGTGYVITVNGPTLTNGSATIPGWTSATAAGSNRGTSNWGMNLRANTTATSTVAVGADITAASDGTNLKGQALAGYSTVDQFKFVSGDSVANSAYDGVSNNTLGPTNSQVYTASYAVNVAGNQLAGTYTTTLTYICTPTF
jgi:hypothetical protein